MAYASAIWIRTNRYNTEVYKKRYKTFLNAIPRFCRGRKIISLKDKTKLSMDIQFYNFSIYKYRFRLRLAQIEALTLMLFL